MQSIASLPVLDDLTDDARSALLTDATLCSLADVFARLPDPRSRHGKRYELPFLLTCLVAALLCGATSPDAVGQWCRDHRPLLRGLFGPRRHLTPSGSLYRRLLPRLSAATPEWALAGWVLHTRPHPDREPVALDGKTVCGAAGTTRAPHLLSVSGHVSGETLIQVQVDAKTNEIPVAQDLLGWLALGDRMVTADALHTTSGFAQTVLDHGGHYLLPVKGNTARLQADLIDYFTDPTGTWEEATTRDRGRGRTEERRLHVTSELTGHLTFPGVQQAMEIQRRITTKAGTREETWYYVTDCPRHDLDPVALLRLIRGHWSVECRHWLRDVVFGEDRSRIRTGSAPHILAALRNAILTLLYRSGHHDVTATCRTFAAYPRRAFALIRRRFPVTR